MKIIDVMVQSLGFLMQTVPIAVLCLVPFQNEALRVSRRRFNLLFCAGLVLSSVGFAWLNWLLYQPDGSHGALVINGANLYMVVNILLFAFTFWGVVRATTSRKIIVFMILIHYAAIMYILCGMTRGMFIEDTVKGQVVAVAYARVDILIYAVILLVTFPFIYVFFRREVRADLDLMEDTMLRRSCIYVAIAILLFCASVYALNLFGFYYGYLYGPMLFFVLSVIVTDAFLYYVLFSEIRLAKKNQRLEEQLRSFDEQYREISSHIEEARRARHDIRHHLNHISVMNSRGEQKELERYLEAYEVSCRELEQMPLSGYPALDNILQYYMERAKENDIEIKAQFGTLKQNPGFDVIDMTVLLGNLMENAMEACCKMPQEQERFIRIWVKQADVQLLIEIENSCRAANDDHPEFTDGTCFVSSKHKAVHGQGLKSIRLVAEKYGGNAEFKKADGIFTARVVLNIL